MVAKRISVLLDANGQLVHTWGDVSVGVHPAEVLEYVRAWTASR